ncbi:hypothetical protein EJ04DRAFT_515413 [Polyplosphaeria fusca]|uniref:Uncharacterized protein n=1 Tax=Polyplosphaeria fusca TaxID=682080 RepID=A0A9P4UXD2_9PLEO|nr:hypothetical protein EJ04DRAFT_515413 [Polyplosphaeria fusca]
MYIAAACFLRLRPLVAAAARHLRIKDLYESISRGKSDGNKSTKSIRMQNTLPGFRRMGGMHGRFTDDSLLRTTVVAGSPRMSVSIGERDMS